MAVDSSCRLLLLLLLLLLFLYITKPFYEEPSSLSFFFCEFLPKSNHQLFFFFSFLFLSFFHIYLLPAVVKGPLVSDGGMGRYRYDKGEKRGRRRRRGEEREEENEEETFALFWGGVFF